MYFLIYNIIHFQISILCEQSQLREKELLSKAKCAQEAHSKITIELRELVTAQQTMSSRYGWKLIT